MHLSLPSVFLGDFGVQEWVYVKGLFSYISVQCPDLPTPPRWGRAPVMCSHGPLQCPLCSLGPAAAFPTGLRALGGPGWRPHSATRKQMQEVSISDIHQMTLGR